MAGGLQWDDLWVMLEQDEKRCTSGKSQRWYDQTSYLVTCMSKGRDHWEGRWSFSDKTTKAEGRWSFSIKKDTKYSGVWLGVNYKKALYHEDVLNERLVELKNESYQKVYYIDKIVIRITIK